LTLYNLTLQHLEERRLGSLSEASEPRRVLDDNFSHCVGYCQEQGLWAFMTRSVQQDASTSVVPAFGYQYAFNLAPDWVRTVLVSTSPYFDPPLTQYHEEAGFLYANFTPLYISYVSNDPLYGYNLGAWPEVFTEFVATALARRTCKRITGSTDLLNGADGLIAQEKRARIDARSKDAMNLPPGFMPQSTWVRARRGFLTNMPGSGDNGALPAGGF
jgi:hypothetical protein